ncbi:RHTO0S19e03290g1_1 [Rhodotorula toruloides]|uniref:RHTO0S19e03290g1_1 n=2 Tax=Rhodotorula toruloides TaxID=5286 RepID=A0A061BNR9_RHOTO|nr:uncharacterized protein RHTO_03623 [Rhodotorula toruloides NP11]EMS20090.1 hypothetical protein RHTO_03623 [Rhodotorula toruloides NP11]CDR48724.1 RHTO0S19e03290g1_1 [Rhodotorula toruloides]
MRSARTPRLPPGSRYRTLKRQRRLRCRGSPTPCGCPPPASRPATPRKTRSRRLNHSTLSSPRASNRMAKRRKVRPRVPLTADDLEFGRRATATARAKLEAQRLLQPVVPAIQQDDDDSDASDDSVTPSSARRTPSPTPDPAPAPSSSPGRASPELGVFPSEHTPLDSTDPEDEIVVVSFQPSAKKARVNRKRRLSSSPSLEVANGAKRSRPDKKRATTSRHRSRTPKETGDIKPSPRSSSVGSASSATNTSSSFVLSTTTAATVASASATGSAAINVEIAGYQKSLLGEGSRLAEDGHLGQLDAVADNALLFSCADFRAVTEQFRAQTVLAEQEETATGEPEEERRSWWSCFVAFLH